MVNSIIQKVGIFLTASIASIVCIAAIPGIPNDNFSTSTNNEASLLTNSAEAEKLGENKLTITNTTVQNYHSDLLANFNIQAKNGKFIDHLNQYSFRITDTGTPITDYTIRKNENKSRDNYVIFVLDISGSMKGNPYAEAFDGIKDFLSKSGDSFKFGGVVFSDEVASTTGFVKSKQELLRQITKQVENISHESTSLYDGIKQGLDIFDKENGKKVLVVLSDGGENASSHSHSDVVTLSNSKGISIITVGIEGTDFDSISKNRLLRLSGETGGFYLPAKSINDVSTIYSDVLDLISQEYELTYKVPFSVNPFRILKIEAIDDSGTIFDTSSYVYKSSWTFIPETKEFDLPDLLKKIQKNHNL